MAFSGEVLQHAVLGKVSIMRLFKFLLATCVVSLLL